MIKGHPVLLKRQSVHVYYEKCFIILSPTYYLILSIQFLTNYLVYVDICASPLPPSAGDNVGGGILKFAS